VARALAETELARRALAGDVPSMIEWLRRHDPEWLAAVERVKRFD
jgi:hypothetical protein